MTMRRFAALRERTEDPRVRHMLGFPPNLVPGAEEQIQLPEPELLVIDVESDQSTFLYRLTKIGDAAGDTWHTGLAEALAQAEFEFAGRIGEWQEIPESASDACDYAIASIQGGVTRDEPGSD